MSALTTYIKFENGIEADPFNFDRDPDPYDPVTGTQGIQIEGGKLLGPKGSRLREKITGI